MGKDLVPKEGHKLIPSGGDNPLEGIELSEEAANRLFVETVGESVAGTLFAFVGLDKLWNFLGTYQQKTDNARLLILLRDFKNKHENSEKFQEALKKLLTIPAGVNLFQKVVRIVNANMTDLSYVELLANALKKISDSDFKELFEEHNYVLSQIEKLTPQALMLLKDKALWPNITFASSTASGVTSGKGWDTAFANLYADKKGTPDSKIRTRIVHAVNELKNNNLVGLEATHVPLTAVGEEVCKYLH